MIVEETISYININGNEHPIDACSIDGKNDEYFQESGKLVNHISSSSTDEEYPSAKCLYDMIWGIGGEHDDEPLYDYSKEYLTFEAIDDGTFKFTRNSLEYSIDDGNTWVNLPANTNTPTVPSGNKIMFRKTNPSISMYGIGSFSSTGKFNAFGNVMSLIYGDDFEDQTSLNGNNYIFRQLFSQCTRILNASNLILPATTLTRACYYRMFYRCTSLTSTPELPATTLANDCYLEMFYGCTSLTSAPKLPATTLVYGCYTEMFYNCTSLNYIECYAINNVIIDNSKEWVKNVSESGTFIGDQNAIWYYSEHGIPENWNTNTNIMILPTSKGTRGVYVGNVFTIDDSIDMSVENYEGSNEYEYTGETIQYRNSTYYVWQRTDGLYDTVKYAYTHTNDYNSLYAKSLEADLRNIDEHPISYLVSDDNTIYSTSSYQNLVAIRRDGDNMYIYVDDFFSTRELPNFDDLGFLVSDPGAAGARYYEYCCEYTYRNDIYDLWVLTDDGYNNTQSDYKYMLISKTYDIEQRSVEYSYSNIGVLTRVIYMDAHLQNALNTVNTTVIKTISRLPVSEHSYGMYIDDFIKCDDNLTEWISNPESKDANEYIYTRNTFEYNNTTYFVWVRTDQQYDCVTYALTTTVDYNTLYEQSLEYSLSNLNTHPISYFSDDNNDIYSTGLDQNIIKVVSSNGNLIMYVDDFVRDIDVNNPKRKGANYYEYCGTLEYDGDTYYAWVMTDDGNDVFSENVKYILTNEDPQGLQTLSLEYSIDNILSYPIVAYLNEDLEAYEFTHQKYDNVIKVFEIIDIHSAGTLGMYVDDFPEYAYEDAGYDNVYDFLNEYYMHNPEHGGNYYEYCASFEYDGDNYYIWKLTDDGHNGVDSNLNNTIQVRYVLTNTINFQTLYQESLEHSLSNIESHTNPLICYLDEDLNETYIAEERTDYIITVFQL